MPSRSDIRWKGPLGGPFYCRLRHCRCRTPTLARPGTGSRRISRLDRPGGRRSPDPPGPGGAGPACTPGMACAGLRRLQPDGAGPPVGHRSRRALPIVPFDEALDEVLNPAGWPLPEHWRQLREGLRALAALLRSVHGPGLARRRPGPGGHRAGHRPPAGDRRAAAGPHPPRRPAGPQLHRGRPAGPHEGARPGGALPGPHPLLPGRAEPAAEDPQGIPGGLPGPQRGGAQRPPVPAGARRAPQPGARAGAGPLQQRRHGVPGALRGGAAEQRPCGGRPGLHPGGARLPARPAGSPARPAASTSSAGTGSRPTRTRPWPCCAGPPCATALLPDLGQDRLHLLEARHPLLLPGVRAALDLEPLEPRGRSPSPWSWTGSARGWSSPAPTPAGKTVVLKTVGLLTALARSGCAIPATAGHRSARTGHPARGHRRPPDPRGQPLHLLQPHPAPEGHPRPGHGAAAWCSWTSWAPAPTPRKAPPWASPCSRPCPGASAGCSAPPTWARSASGPCATRGSRTPRCSSTRSGSPPPTACWWACPARAGPSPSPPSWACPRSSWTTPRRSWASASRTGASSCASWRRTASGSWRRPRRWSERAALMEKDRQILARREEDLSAQQDKFQRESQEKVQRVLDFLDHEAPAPGEGAQGEAQGRRTPQRRPGGHRGPGADEDHRADRPGRAARRRPRARPAQDAPQLKEGGYARHRGLGVEGRDRQPEGRPGRPGDPPGPAPGGPRRRAGAHLPGRPGPEAAPGARCACASGASRGHRIGDQPHRPRLGRRGHGDPPLRGGLHRRRAGSSSASSTATAPAASRPPCGRP